MKTVVVFKTDVPDQQMGGHLIWWLRQYFAGYKVSFDLDDCDRVLRVENCHGPVAVLAVQQLVAAEGYTCELL